MRLQHLADVHARGHAERIQHDIHRATIGHVRHVLDRDNARDNAFIAVAAGHLVAGLQPALHCQVHLDHFQHARGQVIARGEFGFFLDKTLFELLLELGEVAANLLQRLRRLFVLETDIEPLRARQLLEVGLGDAIAILEAGGTAVGGLADELALEAHEGVVLDDAVLVVEVLADAGEILLLDALGARVLVHAFAREHVHVDDRSGHARRHAQAGVLHVRGLLAENRAQQLLFRRQLGLALGRDLAHQDVARVHLGADVNDAGLVELGQRRFTDVGDVARDFLGTEFGVARHCLQFFDMDGGEVILIHHALGDENRVLEVVAVPRHERDQHVASEREFAHVGALAVGQHVALGEHVADLHHRTLVDVGVLVRTRVLGEVVDVHADIARPGFVVVDAHHDARGIHRLDRTAAARHQRGAGVDGAGALDAGADQRLLGDERRHRLALHVGTHERAVGVVVLEERNQRRGHRHDLRRRDVDIFHLVRRGQHEFVLAAARDQLVGEAAARVECRVRLRDHELALLDGGQVIHLVDHLAVVHLAVRRLEETVLVGARIHRERVDQADVRAFRRFDRAHAAVMRRVHIAHLETGAFTGQATRSERRHAALVRHFGQRVGLVHELAQL